MTTNSNSVVLELLATEVNVMAVVGLLVLLAAAGLSLDVVFENKSSTTVYALGQSFTLSSAWPFLAGLITGVVGLLGVAMILSGMARARRRRVAMAKSRGSHKDLQAERDHLAAELDQERASRP